jgi:hypothetical protein
MQKTRTIAKAPPKKKTVRVQGSGVVLSRIRAIGNSRGVILNSQLIDQAGISPDGPIEIRAGKGMIVITASKNASRINTDLGTWDTQFKKAIRERNKPEGDLWEGMGNVFDQQEWE